MIEEADASIFDWIMTPLSSLENFGNFGDGF